MASELCMNCFSVKGQYETCPFCGYTEGTPPNQPHYLMPGTVLSNHFIVGTAIGVGGFGITYKCFDTTLGVIVAVKEFFPAGLVNRAPGEMQLGLLSGEKERQYREQTARFLMEAQSIAQFGKAKDIVNVYDYFEENNTAYIIMEYIDGVLLKDYLNKQGRMEVPVAMAIIEPIIEAVKKIHAQGIIHRDISPDNIFIAGEDAVKVFDFGAARLNDSEAGTAAEKVIKVGYSAPEQYRDTASQSYYTDIYSVGAILYEMVTGIKPIESTEREYKDEMPSPLELGVTIDENLDRAIMEAMAVQPELRYQGIQQLDDAIHGKRIAEYPKDKLRRRKHKRNWLVAGSILVMSAVIVFVALINTVFKGRNEIFDGKIIEEETVEIWVDNEDTKSMYESIGERMKEAEKDDSSRIKDMKKEISKNVTFNVTVVKDMESRLANAKVEGKMPTIFVTDTVKNIDNYELVSLKDTVYEAIDADQYFYMASYLESYPEAKEMPTGFDVLLLYVVANDENVIKKRDGLRCSTLLGKAESDKSIPLETIIEANQTGKEFTWMSGATATKLAIMQNPESFDYKNKGTFSFGTNEGNFLQNLLDLLKIRRGTIQEKNGWKQTDDADSELIHGNSFLAGTGYRQTINNVKIGVKSLSYEVYVPTVDEKMLVSYENKLAVSATANSNQQLAAKRFIYFALEQQETADKRNTPFPISAVKFGKKSENGNDTGNNAFEVFFNYNSQQKAVKNLVQENRFPCLLISKGSGTILDFGKQMEELASGDSLTLKAVDDQCKQFQSQ